MKQEDFNNIVNKYGDSVLRLCFMILKDYHAAEDITQEAFLSVFRSHTFFRGESSVKTWITKIAMNKCYSYLRKAYHKHESPGEVEIEEKPLEISLETGPVTEAIMSLPEKDRQAVLLYYYQELSIKEAAKVAKVRGALQCKYQ